MPSLPDTAYIYSVPSSVNCSGMVSALGYCYRIATLGSEQLILTLLTLEQKGLNFVITNAIRVLNTPTDQICSEAFDLQYCCDSYALQEVDRFRLPASNFTFAIVPSSSATLLRFNDAVYPQYQVEHYQQNTAGLETGDSILVSVGSTSNTALLLFQFMISEFKLLQVTVLGRLAIVVFVL